MSTPIVTAQHSFDELLGQMGQQRMTDTTETGVNRPSDAYLKINVVGKPRLPSR